MFFYVFFISNFLFNFFIISRRSELPKPRACLDLIIRYLFLLLKGIKYIMLLILISFSKFFLFLFIKLQPSFKTVFLFISEYFNKLYIM